MNKRIVEIINIIKSSDSNIHDLEKQFNVSNRTVRNDLKLINTILEENNLNKLEVRQGGCIYKGEDFNEIIRYIDIEDLYSYKLSKEERIDVAIIILLNEAGFISLAELAERLYVSRATIVADVNDIKSKLNKNYLNLLSHKSKGVVVEGLESRKRRLLLNIIIKNNNDLMRKYLFERSTDTEDIIRKIITEQEQINERFLTDDAFERVNVYLQIMVERNLQGRFIEVKSIADPLEHTVAHDVMKYICQYCQIATVTEEITMLNYILSTSKYIKKHAIDENTVKIQFITRKFIDKISEKLLINLNDDYIFFENLSSHLRSVITENPDKYPDNSVLEEIIGKNPNVFTVVNDSVKILQQHVKRVIELTEVHYIVVHVCAALERRKSHDVSFDTVIACNYGYGTSRLLFERLKKYFKLNIIDIVSVREASIMKRGQAELLISTVKVENSEIEQVVVSPLFTDEDYLRVSNKIEKLEKNKQIVSSGIIDKYAVERVVKEILPIIRELAPDKYNDLEYNIKEKLGIKNHKNFDVKDDLFTPSLSSLLKVEHITVGLSCEDWKDSIKKSAKILVDKVYAEEVYVDAMIGNIERNGPYVIISEGFAAPHASAEDGALKLGMSLIRLESPVSYSDSEDVEVEFVCSISAIDGKSHLKAFFTLVNLLSNNTYKDMLKNTRTSEDIHNLIVEFERSEL